MNDSTFNRVTRVSAEEATAAFENMLVGLVGLVPGSEMDFARKAWADAMRVEPPENMDADVLVSMSDHRRIIIMQVPLADAMELSQMIETAHHEVPELREMTTKQMSASAACAVTEVLDAAPMYQDVPDDQRPAVYARALDIATGMLCHIYRRTLRENGKDETVPPGSVLFGHVIRQTSGQPGLLYSTIVRRKRDEPRGA